MPLIQCPHCSEEIQSTAKKCKHCGEWLDGRDRLSASIAKGIQQQENTDEVKLASAKFTLGCLGFIVGLIVSLLISGLFTPPISTIAFFASLIAFCYAGTLSFRKLF
ncbi:hypothetical protein [Pseudanabaena mucicola]|uniref:hypothetical protein n=1 Tax=Pseudanabaena mucicola TaxID=71190 RepID=UPI002578BCA2|nr:hypothetical protein [Pseudanabaena mucicola]